MRILNVAASLDPRDGGTSERTLQMSRALYDAGADVSVLTTDKHFDEVKLGSLPRNRVEPLPLLNERFYLPRVTYSRIREIVTEVDVVHLMSHWTYINGIVGRAAWSAKKPYVICPAGALKKTGTSRNLKALYDRVVGRDLVRRADRLIAISAIEIEDILAYGVPESRVVILPNAVDLEEYSHEDDEGFRRRFGLSNRPFVLFLGRLHAIKGPDLLVDAFVAAELPTLDLVLAGPDGGMQQELQQMVIRYGAEDRVRLIGHISGREKSYALHAASLLVIPSRREAMSIVVLEAGAAGTPVLITDRCGFNEIETFGGGRVVPASVEGLRDGLVELLREAVDLKAMGRRLRQTAEAFSWQARVSEYLVLYGEILNHRGN